jgi:hypothetical protein
MNEHVIINLDICITSFHTKTTMTKQTVYDVAIIVATSDHICGSRSIETRILPFGSKGNPFILLDVIFQVKLENSKDTNGLLPDGNKNN